MCSELSTRMYMSELLKTFSKIKWNGIVFVFFTTADHFPSIFSVSANGPTTHPGAFSFLSLPHAVLLTRCKTCPFSGFITTIASLTKPPSPVVETDRIVTDSLLPLLLTAHTPLWKPPKALPCTLDTYLSEVYRPCMSVSLLSPCPPRFRRL